MYGPLLTSECWDIGCLDLTGTCPWHLTLVRTCLSKSVYWFIGRLRKSQPRNCWAIYQIYESLPWLWKVTSKGSFSKQLNCGNNRKDTCAYSADKNEATVQLKCCNNSSESNICNFVSGFTVGRNELVFLFLLEIDKNIFVRVTLQYWFLRIF
jgi:hypothetical protein